MKGRKANGAVRGHTQNAVAVLFGISTLSASRLKRRHVRSTRRVLCWCVRVVKRGVKTYTARDYHTTP